MVKIKIYLDESLTQYVGTLDACPSNYQYSALTFSGVTRFTVDEKDYEYYFASPARMTPTPPDTYNYVRLPETGKNVWTYFYTDNGLRFQYMYYNTQTPNESVLSFRNPEIFIDQWRRIGRATSSTTYTFNYTMTDGVTRAYGLTAAAVSMPVGGVRHDMLAIGFATIDTNSGNVGYWGLAYGFAASLNTWEIPPDKRYKPTRKRNLGGAGSGIYSNSTPEQINAPARNAWFSFASQNGVGLTYYVTNSATFNAFVSFLYGGQVFTDSAKYQTATVGAFMLPVSVDRGSNIAAIYCSNKTVTAGVTYSAIMSNRVKTGNTDFISLDAQSYGDYNDTVNTEYRLYLPFYGTVNISPRAIAGGGVAVRWAIDCYTGSITYWVDVRNRNDATLHLYGVYSGNCAVQIPVNGSYNSPLFSRVSSLAGLAAGVATGNAAAVVGGIAGAASTFAPHIDRGGLINPDGVVCQPLTITLHITVKNIIRRENELSLIGKPAGAGLTLSDVTGFIRVDEIDLTGAGIDADDMAEIKSILGGGVYV